MNYYSIYFGIFFAVVVTLYYIAPQSSRVWVLLSASALFYMSYVPHYIVILLALITVDYTAGLVIERARSAGTKKAWLIVSLTANLGLMAAFKYSFDLFRISLGVIPLGLSFHTFQAMAYTIEVYRGRQPAERSFTVYALYILFFPQIAAGPIERPQNLIHQFRESHRFSYANTVAGLQLMAWGFFEKYVVAEYLGTLVNSLYGNPAQFSGPSVAFMTVCFSFQILCDFSGYCDIATGAAQVLGFRLTRNFNRPFFADSMSEYWKRWHISFSYWLRDYVFFPICGRRPSSWRVCIGILVVFLGNGLWHGARWNYAISGLLHGIYRVTELFAGRAMSRSGWTLNPIWNGPVRVVRTLLVFGLMTFAFIFFRGENLSQSFGVIQHLFSGWRILATPFAIAGEFSQSGLGTARLSLAIALIVAVLVVQAQQAIGPLRSRIGALRPWLRWSLYYTAAATLLVAGKAGTPFIYFRF